MLPMLASEVATRSRGKYFGSKEIEILGISTDHREVSHGDLFIAISGSKVDGYDFVGSAMERGALVAMVERSVDSPHILVANVVEALAHLGRSLRQEFRGPVIGVTGSAGKTTTKEFLAAALSTLGQTLKSTGNRNTEFTSPLTWLDLEPQTKFAVIEMAMRGAGQIAHLASISAPTLGVITNVGYSHLLQVGSRSGIAKAKGELLAALPADGVAILWGEDDFLHDLMGIAAPRRTCTFGFDWESDCQITHYSPKSWTSVEVAGRCFGVPWGCTLRSVGRHIALDAGAAILAASLCGVEPEVASHALESLALPPMRMEIREINGATILLDTYNASPPSMLAAIETLCEMPASGKRYAILGQMLELGGAEKEAHSRVGEAVSSSCLDEVIFVGDSMKYALARVGNVTASLVESDKEPRDLVARMAPGDSMLIKGSRALQLERILGSA